MITVRHINNGNAVYQKTQKKFPDYLQIRIKNQMVAYPSSFRCIAVDSWASVPAVTSIYIISIFRLKKKEKI